MTEIIVCSKLLNTSEWIASTDVAVVEKLAKVAEWIYVSVHKQGGRCIDKGCQHMHIGGTEGVRNTPQQVRKYVCIGTVLYGRCNSTFSSSNSFGKIARTPTHLGHLSTRIPSVDVEDAPRETAEFMFAF